MNIKDFVHHVQSNGYSDGIYWGFGKGDGAGYGAGKGTSVGGGYGAGDGDGNGTCDSCGDGSGSGTDWGGVASECETGLCQGDRYDY